MQLKRWMKVAGILVGVALLGSLAAGVRGPFGLLPGFRTEPRAAPPDPGAAAAPATPTEAGAATPAATPTDAGQAAPAAPATDAGAAAAPATPTDAVQASPQEGSGGKIGWGRDFKTWDVVTGYVVSNSHGNRLVQTYIYPSEAARIYKHNAELARLRKTEGFQDFPVGTQIVTESWLRNELGGPGEAGPVFFMRKERSGYDPAGRDWHYGFTQNDLALIGEGHDGKLAFCKECHARAERRDYVFATER